MVQLRGMYGDCDCETCKGSEIPESENGEIIFGGWRCCCPCHRKKLNEKNKISIIDESYESFIEEKLEQSKLEE